MPRSAGSIQICRKCVVSFGAWLNSLCITPRPALMRCTSPGRITPEGAPALRPLPMLSLCASSPLST